MKIKNKLLVSVVLATYNVEKTLERFFDSYEKLNYQNRCFLQFRQAELPNEYFLDRPP